MRNNFQHKPYMRDELLEKNYDKLIHIEAKIKEQLADFENFDGIDFCDVGARGIQIRGHHKEVKGYCYGDQITIEYDFSNKDEAIERFVSMWRKSDTKEKVTQYNNFLADGARWGWD